MVKKRKKKQVDDVSASHAESDIILSPQQKKKLEEEARASQLSEAKKQKILAEYLRADNWFKENKEEEFTYGQDASISYLRNADTWHTRSTIFDSSTEKACRSLIAKYVNAITEYLIALSLSGVGVSDIKKATVLKKLIFTTLQKMPDFFENILTFIRQVVIYGTGVGKVTYHRVHRNIKSRKYDESKGTYEVENRRVKIYDGPYFMPINVTKNFRIDPEATKLNGYKKFHIVWKTYGELKQLAAMGIYKNIDKITLPADRTLRTASEPRDYDALNSTPQAPPLEDDPIEVIEFWSADDSKVVTIANRQAIIKEEANPFFHGRHPFVYSNFEKLDFQFYGRGAPVKAKPEQTLINSFTNLMVDGMVANINPMYKAVEGEFTADYLPFTPLGVIKVPSLDSVVPFEKSPVDMQAMQWVFRLQQDIEEKTGATKQTTGMGSDSKRSTATEFKGMYILGNELHHLNVKMLTEVGFIEILRRVYWLILQCMTEEMQVKITEDDSVKVSPSDLPLDLDFELKFGSTEMSKELAQQNLVFLFQAVGPALVKMGVGPKVIMKIVAKMLDNMGFKPEEFGISEKELEKLGTAQPGGEQAPAGREQANVQPNAAMGPGPAQIQGLQL